MAKEAEKRVVALANHYNWYRHKYGDVRYCVHCHQALPKTERAPDFAIAPVFTWMEAKNNNSSGRWPWVEIGPEGDRVNQREWLIENGGWLFIELSEDDAHGSKGRGAFLVPFKSWLSEVEPYLIEKGYKSLRLSESRKRPGADTLLVKWELEWETNVGWVIPDGHVWWKALADRIEVVLREVLPKCQ